MNGYSDGLKARDRIPLLWLCGPPGVGKTTVGWQFFSQLSQDGIKMGYLDIDQLGMCYPAPVSDPDRHHIKSQNLGAMVTTFKAAGAQCILVSGVVDETHGIRDYANVLPNTSQTLCRLHANAEQLKDRILKRGQGIGPRLPGDALNGQPITVLQKITREAIETSEILQHNAIGNLCINTDNRTIEEVAQMILAEINFK
jgi:DNA polymerase III delta prime subunit